MTSPENYKVVTGGSSTSEDSDDENEREAIHCLEEDLYRESNEENDMLDGFSGVKEKVMEVGESSEIMNHNLPEICSPGASGSCREPVPLRKNPASQSRIDNRKSRVSVSGSDGKDRDMISGKLLMKNKVEFKAELTRNEETPEEWKDPAKYFVKCDFCDSKAVLHSNSKVINEEETFAKKELIGESKVKCDQCGKIISYQHLSRHYLVVHPGFKLHPGKCGICGIMMIHQVKLKHHLKLIHGKI